MNALQATATAEPVGTPVGTAPPRLSGPQPLNDALIDAVATSGCGWSRKQIEILEASWPLEAGWREKLVAQDRILSAEDVAALFAAKDVRAAKRADIAAAESLPCPWCAQPVPRITQGGHLKEFCNKRHKVAFNNALTTAAIEYARLLRTPGALKTWAVARVNPTPSGAEGLPRVTEGAGQQGDSSAPPRDETS